MSIPLATDQFPNSRVWDKIPKARTLTFEDNQTKTVYNRPRVASRPKRSSIHSAVYAVQHRLHNSAQITIFGV